MGQGPAWSDMTLADVTKVCLRTSQVEIIGTDQTGAKHFKNFHENFHNTAA